MEVRRIDPPDPALAGRIRELAARATRVDGTAPLNEQTRFGLDRSDVVHLLAGPADAPAGYAQVAGSTAEIAVDTAGDRLAVATALLAAVADAGARYAWAHGGRGPVADALAETATPDRVLLELRRPDAPVEAVAMPAGTRLRAFRPGQDEDAWLAVNARAFADHREQGGWTRGDLEARERSDWFDPDGFLLAVPEGEDGRILGFHWTKQEPGENTGEVYVIAVDPDAQGHGLARPLLTAGLARLREHGVREIVLFTDEDNAAARGLYERTGFVENRRDVQFRL